jgi:hypothetical protein
MLSDHDIESIKSSLYEIHDAISSREDIRLRERAAIAAMQSIMRGCSVSESHATQTAKFSVMFADALIKELNRVPPKSN